MNKRISDQKSVLDGFVSLAQSGRRWAVAISPDPSKGAGDERFLSRMVQLAYEEDGASAARSVAACLVTRRGLGGKGEPSSAENWCREVILRSLAGLLDQRGHEWVVLDDCLLVLVRSERAACRVLASLERAIARELHAPMFVLQGRVAPLADVSVCGKRVVATESGMVRVLVHPQAVSQVKAHVRAATARSAAIPNPERKTRLRRACREAEELFRGADDAAERLRELRDWSAARVRSLLWKQWKTVRGRASALEKLLGDCPRARRLASMRCGCWVAANSAALKRALPPRTLRRLGFPIFTIADMA